MRSPVLVLVLVLGMAARPTSLSAQQSAPIVTTLTIFAGAESGLWRSSDWGHRWERVTTGGQGASLADIGAVRAILALGPQVYIGSDSGLFVSDDFGLTWRATGLAVPVSAVLPSRYPTADPTLFAATRGGLLRSLDGARTFAPTALRDTWVHRLEWPGPALVAATANGVLVSEDAGATVTGPGRGLPPGDARALALSSYFAADPVLFAGVGATGVHRSSDGGKTWAPSGLDGHTVTDLVWLGPFLYAVSERGLFRSEDAGKSWTSLRSGLGDAVPSRILFPLAPDSGAEVFLATAGGIYRSADGGAQWAKSGMDGERVLVLGTFPPPQRPLNIRRRR
jgi:photosystem II stability/assembly factor-like uncharacterized protein